MKTSQPTSLRILFVGSTGGTSTSVFYFSNFLKLGHCVYPFDPDYFNTRNLAERAYLSLTKQPPRRALADAESKLIALCEKNAFDLVFVMAQNFISANALRRMREVSRVPTTFIYHSHDNNFSPGVLTPPRFEEVLMAYDYVFTTKSQNVARYRALGQSNSIFVPSAFESSIHKPVGGESRFRAGQFPVSFVGTYDKSRDPIVSKLGWDVLEVWGDHWNKSPEFGKKEARIHNGAIYFFEYADVLSHSLCSLGLLRAEAEDRHTQRTFEIPACGTLQIAPRNEEILSFFTENKEIVCFDSLEELKEKVTYYLAHPSAREKIAKKGRERCLHDKHSYLDRVVEILKTAGLLKGKSLKIAA